METVGNGMGQMPCRCGLQGIRAEGSHRMVLAGIDQILKMRTLSEDSVILFENICFYTKFQSDCFVCSLTFGN